MPTHEATMSSSGKGVRVYLGTVLMPFTDSPLQDCCPLSPMPGRPLDHFYFPKPARSMGWDSWADVPTGEGFSSNKSGLDLMGANSYQHG